MQTALLNYAKMMYGLSILTFSQQFIFANCAVTGQLICAFVFAYAKSRFSHDGAQVIPK